MRHIERMMLNAIADNVPFRMNNTQVIPSDGCDPGRVLLDGNEIATFNRGVRWLNESTLMRWPTRTTMSRLRALGFNVCQKNHEVIIGDHDLLKS